MHCPAPHNTARSYTAASVARSHEQARCLLHHNHLGSRKHVQSPPVLMHSWHGTPPHTTDHAQIHDFPSQGHPAQALSVRGTNTTIRSNFACCACPVAALTAPQPPPHTPHTVRAVLPCTRACSTPPAAPRTAPPLRRTRAPGAAAAPGLLHACPQPPPHPRR